jgi:glutaredoxin
MAKEYFKEKGLEYEDVDVSTNEAAQKEAIEKSGIMGVPIIDIDGQIVAGFDKPKINKILNIN